MTKASEAIAKAYKAFELAFYKGDANTISPSVLRGCGLAYSRSPHRQWPRGNRSGLERHRWIRWKHNTHKHQGGSARRG